MIPLGIIGGQIAKPPLTTQFYKTTGSVTVPSGYTSARITVIGAGGLSRGAANGDGTSSVASGGGGGLAQSVIAVTGGETLSAVVSNPPDTITAGGTSSLSRGGTMLVSATAGGAGSASPYSPSSGSPGSGVIGTTKFAGGYGSTSTSFTGGSAPIYGGGAAGTTSNGSYRYAGTGMSWVQTSDSAVAASGNAVPVSNTTTSADYGGARSAGVSSPNTAGVAIVIIEWGFGQ